MPIVYLTRRATFSASHRLHSDDISDAENKKVFGKCNNPNGHGHNYSLKVTIRGEIDPKTGMMMNISELKNIMNEAVTDEMDHKHLNIDVPAFSQVNPTAENMVVVIWNLLKPLLPKGSLYEVQVQETENNSSTYRGE